MVELLRHRPRGLFFEEFELGQQVATAGRTVTEADVVSFAALSGDYNQIHTDAEFARSTAFGQRVAHGLLVLAIATGLIAQTGALEGTALAFRELTWKFIKPVFLNDTVHVLAEVSGLKALPRAAAGMVSLQVRVINQGDQVVARGEWQALMALKPI